MVGELSLNNSFWNNQDPNNSLLLNNRLQDSFNNSLSNKVSSNPNNNFNPNNNSNPSSNSNPNSNSNLKGNNSISLSLLDLNRQFKIS